MSVRQLLATLLFTLASSAGVRAQSVMLTEAPLVDSCSRVKLTLDLKGKITFQSQGKSQTIEHQAVAEHEFVERVLEAKTSLADKSVRIYHVAKATIAGQSRTLRPKVAFIVAHRIKDQMVTYSPDGPLFGEEMELTEHFDTMVLPGLLPGKSVKVGESWNVPLPVIQAICDLDALDAGGKQELTGTLKTVDGDLAHVTFQGTVKGIQLGAAVAILIDGKSRLVFDAKAKRIVALDWRQSDDRKQGPATPHLAADVIIKLLRTPISTPAELGDLAIIKVPSGLPSDKMTNIQYSDPKGKFVMQHSREWQFVGERNGQRVLKLLTARGDHLADAIVMPWQGPKIADAKAFQELMENTPGWKQDSDSQLNPAVKHPNGYTVYRVIAAGTMEGQAAFRTVYLLGNTTGNQLLLTILTPPSQINSLEGRDETLVENIELK